MAIPKSSIKFYNPSDIEITGGVSTSGLQVTPKVTFPFQETEKGETISSPYTGRLDLSSPAFAFDCVAEDPLDLEVDELIVKLNGIGGNATLDNISWNGTGTASFEGNNITIPSGAGNINIYCSSNYPTLGMYNSSQDIGLDSEVDVDTGNTYNIVDLNTNVSIVSANGSADLGAVRKYGFIFNASIEANPTGQLRVLGAIIITSNGISILTLNLTQLGS